MLQLRNKNMVNFSRGSTTIATLLLATTAYGQCEYNTLIINTQLYLISNLTIPKQIDNQMLEWIQTIYREGEIFGMCVNYSYTTSL